MSEKIPKILYKYRCCDDRTINMLESNQVYFANPRKFNDPFDCIAHDLSDFRESVAKYFCSERLKIPFESITVEQIKPFLDRCDIEPDLISEEEKQAYLEEHSRLGVLSLSEKNDSILMWSHYAASHQGICLGFKNNLGFPVSSLKEVIYSDKRNTDFLFNYFRGNISEENFLIETFMTKYIDWRYEKEWRMIGLIGIEHYPDNSLDRVIFGLKMPQEKRSQIQLILKAKNVKYFEVVKSERNFSIEIREILG